ncbi:MAG: tetratricopeptide repeat protein [Paraburkholderia sp.]|uniref:tetratricopeptide repeat protein n=1 Tax=Paraburkholderia sp. TaxID=1926495 RepID=UPI00120E8412|nr:tetratricopeptide repeat protein [Paraburkholderia sp.]TAM06621.1 MAG: tetratricopeptide repeat protein [Paraburkholderia sp.]TAM28497.1 MAG: tetratricopeptide repeat protein [Paraburkholderia sp.]
MTATPLALADSANADISSLAATLPADQRAALVHDFVATIDKLTSIEQHDDACAIARQMTQILPNEGYGWKTLAYDRLRRGDLPGSRDLLRQAALLLPPDPQLATHLAAAEAMFAAGAASRAGQHEEAIRQFETVLAVYPHYPDANHGIAMALLALGRPLEALPRLETALGINPNNGQYWANYIDALIHAKRLKAAWVALELGQRHGLQGPVVDQLINLMGQLTSAADYTVQATHQESAKPQPEPTAEPTHTTRKKRDPTRKQIESLATPYNDRHFDVAEKNARAFLKQFPGHALGMKVLGVALFSVGKLDEARQCLGEAYALNPQDADVLHAYVATLEAAARHSEALAVCEKLVEFHPDHAEGARLQGVVLFSLGRLDESERSFAQARRLGVDPTNLAVAQGALYVRQGRLGDAADQFRLALQHTPDNGDAWGNLMFTLAHDETVSADQLFAEHRRFGEHFESKFRAQWPAHPNTREPGRRLRIGIVSADLRAHAVANFLLPVLPGLAKDPGLELYAYSNTPGSDQVTTKLREHFAHWHTITRVPDDDVIRQIRADRIDILIDLGGHTAENRLLVFARKPAPLAACWIGYPGTTGLSAVDYFIGDRFWVPNEAFRARFTEKIAYLPAVAPFYASTIAPPINALPALSNGYVTFGSFNRLEKLRRHTIALWAQLLRAIPTARMQIGAMPSDETGSKQLLAWFDEEGIARERISFRSRGSLQVFLQQHYAVDICFDSIPYGGLTTALQSLWMGVPTLTLAGETVPGRSGATVMGHAQLDRFVACDKQDFVRRGVELANDIPALAELRATARERCLASPMFQPDVVAQSVSRALRTMWQRWCAGLPAETFDVTTQNPAS